MKNYLQYFNVEKMGRFPNGEEALFPSRMGVFTKFGGAPDTKGHTVFVIAGLGKPKAYFLWEVFTVDDVQSDGTQYTVSGPGWVLLPPALLTGKDFDAFKNSCANFVTFRSIDELPYCATLRKIADDHHHAEPTSTSDDFCTELIRLLPKNGDTYVLSRDRAITTGTHQRLERRLRSGTETRHQLHDRSQIAAIPARGVTRCVPTGCIFDAS